MIIEDDQERAIQEIIPDIVSRNDWSARKPRRKRKLVTPVKKILFCHTKTNPCYSKEHCIKEVQSIQKKHMDELNKSDVQHNFLIGRDGNVYEGRGWTSASSKLQGVDENDLSGKCLEVAIIGHEVQKASALQVKAALGLMVTGIRNKYIEEKFAVYHFDFNEPIFPQGFDDKGQEMILEDDEDEEDEENKEEDDEEE